MKSKTNFKKLLSIALACVMMVVVSVSGVGSVAFADENVNEYILMENGDGTFSIVNNTMSKFSLKERYQVTQIKDKESIFQTDKSKFFQRTEDNKFIPVIEKKILLRDFDFNAERTVFPAEIQNEIDLCKTNAIKFGDNETVLQYYLSKTNDNYYTLPYTKTVKDGQTFYHYELYCLNRNPGWFTLVSGRNVTEAALDAIIAIVESTPTPLGAVISLFDIGKSLLDVFRELAENADIVLNTENKVQAKVKYDIHSKHSYYDNPINGILKLGVRTKKAIVNEVIVQSFIDAGYAGVMEFEKVSTGGVLYSKSYSSPEENAYKHGLSMGFLTEEVYGEISDLIIQFECPYYEKPEDWPLGV